MRNNEFPAFLYVLEDPREPGNIRYIGATQGLPNRMHAHRTDAKVKPLPLYVWWRRLVSEGVEPRARVLWQGPLHEAESAEIRAISGYKKLGFDLLNETEGGYCFSNLARARSSRKGTKLSPETRALLSRIHTGKTKSDSHMAAISAAKKGIYPEHFRKSNEARKAEKNARKE